MKRSKYSWISHRSQAVDEWPFAKHHCFMASAEILLKNQRPQVVGSFGSLLDLQNTTDSTVVSSCDIAEIRLDLLVSSCAGVESAHWSHLVTSPLLFTARRAEEGGANALSPEMRIELLQCAIERAAWIDVEVASIREMALLLDEIASRGIPWIASYHDFNHLPPTADLERAAKRARDAGAAIFKAAAKLDSPADLARLAEFQLADHGIPVATMGMGPLAAVSRLLCAQCGSLLNYGYLGSTATAPGQWDSAFLKTAISRLVAFPA
jgi:3-dehydroquinate dehydratase-1